MFENENTVDVTDKIALFAAPNAETVKKVSEEDAALK